MFERWCSSVFECVRVCSSVGVRALVLECVRALVFEWLSHYQPGLDISVFFFGCCGESGERNGNFVMRN